MLDLNLGLRLAVVNDVDLEVERLGELLRDIAHRHAEELPAVDQHRAVDEVAGLGAAGEADRVLAGIVGGAIGVDPAGEQRLAVVADLALAAGQDLPRAAAAADRPALRHREVEVGGRAGQPARHAQRLPAGILGAVDEEGEGRGEAHGAIGASTRPVKGRKPGLRASVRSTTSRSRLLS